MRLRDAVWAFFLALPLLGSSLESVPDSDDAEMEWEMRCLKSDTSEITCLTKYVRQIDELIESQVTELKSLAGQAESSSPMAGESGGLGALPRSAMWPSHFGRKLSASGGPRTGSVSY